MRFFASLGLTLALLGPANAGLDLPAAPGMTAAEVQAAIARAMAEAKAPTAESKVSAVPATGPGAGMCVETVVPSNLVTSGGVQGTAGTCSRILQCGTDAKYVVMQFNVGSGC